MPVAVIHTTRSVIPTQGRVDLSFQATGKISVAVMWQKVYILPEIVNNVKYGDIRCVGNV